MRRTHIYSKDYYIEKLDLLSNPMPWPEYPHLLMSVFLVKVTAPNKQFFIVGPLTLELEALNS